MSVFRLSPRQPVFGVARVALLGCVFLIALISLPVLAGWVFEIPVLVSWGTTLPPMKAITVAVMIAADLCLLLTALSRWREGRGWRKPLGLMANVLAWIVILAGLWTLYLSLRGEDHSEPAWAAPWGGLPSIASSASFILTGLGFWAAQRRTALKLHSFCVLLTSAVAWLALMSLVYGKYPGPVESLWKPVSLPGACIMLLLPAGMAMLRPLSGVGKVLLSPRPSGKMVRLLLPLALGLTFAFALLRTWAERHLGVPVQITMAFYTSAMMLGVAVIILRNAQATARLEQQREAWERRTVRSLEGTRRALAHAEAYFEAAPGGMVVIDNGGYIVVVNSHMQQLFGYEAAEMEGLRLDTLVPGLFDRDEDGTADPSPSGSPVLACIDLREDLQAVRKDGSCFATEIVLGPLVSEGGAMGIVSIRDITKRRTAETALAEREGRFRGIFNSTFQFIGLLTPEGVLLEANGPALKVIGATPEEVVGRNFWDCPWWSHSESEQRRVQEGILLAASGTAVRFQTWHPTPSGHRREVDFSLRPVRNKAGEVAFLVPEGRDITDMVEGQNQQIEKERLYQQEIATSQRRLLLATRAAHLGIWEWDVAANELIWDEQMHRIYQVPQTGSRLPFETWVERLHPDDREAAVAAVKAALQDGKDFEIVFRIMCPDGSVHYIQTKAVAQQDDSGKPVRMLGTNADITQQVLVEAGLQESEERFRHAFEYSAIGFALLEPDGRWMTVNKALCDIVGYAEDELLAGSFQDITHPDDLKTDLENVNKLIRGEITHYQMEKRYLHKNGGVVWILLTASLVKEEDGSPAYFISQVEDITQRHEAERVLKFQQEQLRMLIEHTPAAVAMFDMDMCYVAASRRWVEDYQLQATPLIGRCHYDVFPEIGEDWKAIHRRCLGGEVESRAEDMFVRVDGQQEWLRWEVRPWMDVAGKIGGVVMFTEVITDRKHAAEKIRTSLEEKEVLLREIHHRVKNNMQIISSLLQLQTSSLHDPADVAIFQDCQARIHSMAMVHDRLYRSGNLSTINFGEHLRDLAALMARGQAGGHKHVTVEADCADVELDLDKAIPLGLIATELVTNAFKHAFKDRAQGSIRIHLKKADETRMTLRVQDDGRGLPPGADPSSARTLGLRLVRSLSRQLRAEILFPSTDGGCCVEVTFNV